jgi:hypothetical protein
VGRSSLEHAESRHAVSVVLHVIATIVALSAVVLIPWPTLTADGARYLALVGLIALGLTSLALQRVWAAERPAGTREWADAVADRLLWVGTTAAAAVAPGLTSDLVPENEGAFEETRTERALRVALRAAFRLFGRPAIALAFFLAAMLLHMLVWSTDPTSCPATPERSCAGAYYGAGTDPTPGDFLYFAVNTAFVNLPPDLLAASRLAHAAVVVELLAGVAIVTAFAQKFLGLRS